MKNIKSWLIIFLDRLGVFQIGQKLIVLNSVPFGNLGKVSKDNKARLLTFF